MKVDSNTYSIPKFDTLKNQENISTFIENLKKRFEPLKTKYDDELNINYQVIDKRSEKIKPINTNSGFLFTVSINPSILRKYGKIEVFVDENDSITLSFFYYKDKYFPNHYVLSCIPKNLEILDIIEDFLWYKLLPTTVFLKARLFNESRWSIDSIEYAKTHAC